MRKSMDRKLKYEHRTSVTLLWNNSKENRFLHNWSYNNNILEWAAAAAAKSHQSCLTLCDPIDRSPPGSSVPGASMRNSAHGKGHEEGGLAYAKAWSSLRNPPVPEHLHPKPESVLCSHLHLWLYGGLSPITVSLREGVNVQLQGNKNSWAWQECFSLWTPLKVI